MSEHFRSSRMTAAQARAILAAKKLAFRRRSIGNRATIVGALIAMTVIAILAVRVPDTHSDLMSVLVIACLAFGIFGGMAVGALLVRRLPRAECPRCRHPWVAREGRDVAIAAHLQNWRRCPGCQVEMVDEYLHTVIAGRTPEPVPLRDERPQTVADELTQPVPEPIRVLARTAGWLFLAGVVLVVVVNILDAVGRERGWDPESYRQPWALLAIGLAALALVRPLFRRGPGYPD